MKKDNLSYYEGESRYLKLFILLKLKILNN